MKNSHIETLTKVRTVLKDGKEQQILDFLSKLEVQDTLPDELQEALDKLGNNPFKEPKLFEVIEDTNGTAYKLAIAEEVIGDKVDYFTATEIGKFIYKIEQQIVSKKDKDGNYKVTDATANCDMPRMRATQEIMKLGEDYREMSQNLTEAKDEKAKDKIMEDIKVVDKKIADIIWKETGLKEDDLSPWEVLLVMQMVQDNTNNALLSAMGKPLPI